jgi:hypothetical protein
MAVKKEVKCVRVTFDKPEYGFWDGGARKSGDFTPRPRDEFIRWGSWELNFWFETGKGRSMVQAASFARRYLMNHCRRKATVEVITA